MTQHFRLTVDQDTVISGETFDNGSGPVIANSNVVVRGLISGIFGGQNTLTVGDDIELNGKNNSLVADFNTGLLSLAIPQIVNGLTIEGTQTWTFSDFGFGQVDLLGNPGSMGGIAATAGKAGQKAGGVNEITDQSSLGSMMIGGDPVLGGSGITPTNVDGLTLNVLNDGGSGGIETVLVPTLMVFIAGASFTGSATVHINTENLTDGAGALFAPFIPGVGAGASTALFTAFTHAGLYGIGAGPNNVIGPPAFTNGYTSWVVSNEGATNENIAVSALEATNATSFTLTSTGSGHGASATAGTGGIALWSDFVDPAEWANLTNIDGTALAGQTWISGAESGTFGFLDALVGAVGQKVSVSLGSHAKNFLDMTAWAATAANLTLNGGGGTGSEVDFNNGLVTTAVGFGGFSGFAVVGDADGAIGGIANWANFNGASELLLKAADGDQFANQTANFQVKAAPSTFTVDFQSNNFNDHNWEVDAATGGAGSQLNLMFGNGATSSITNADGTFIATGYDTVQVTDNSTGSNEFFGTAFLVESNVGQPGAALDISDAAGTHLRIGESAIDAAGAGAPGAALVGAVTVELVGGNILNPTVGTIDVTGGGVYLGVTDASSITVAGTLEMRGPDDDFTVGGIATGLTGVNVSAGGAGSWVQGSLGPVAAVAAAGALYTGATGGDTLSATGGGSEVFGDGGKDAITLAKGDNTVYFGTFMTGDNHLHGLVMTDTTDAAYNGFWGLGGKGVAVAAAAITGDNDGDTSTSLSMTTITGFALGPPDSVVGNDTLDFNVDSWAGASGTGTGHLIRTDGTAVPTGTATAVLNTFGSAVAIAGAFDIIEGQGVTVNSAASLVKLLTTTGFMVLGAAPTSGEHILFAYQTTTGVNIADVDFVTGGSANTSADTLAASDIVDLVGVTILGLAAHTSDMVFSAHAA